MSTLGGKVMYCKDLGDLVALTSAASFPPSLQNKADANDLPPAAGGSTRGRVATSPHIPFLQCTKLTTPLIHTQSHAVDPPPLCLYLAFGKPDEVAVKHVICILLRFSYFIRPPSPTVSQSV
jgi:hypothetical protein